MKKTPVVVLGIVCLLLGVASVYGLVRLKASLANDCRGYKGGRMVEGGCMAEDVHGPFSSRLDANARLRFLQKEERCERRGTPTLATLTKDGKPFMWTVYCPPKK